ncbi:MAG: STAS domain-containing protein [Myxococcales bacterium]|nr:STAS domain-containing protein [Myxococcales bacterium]MCB9525058.1 STAS domain-containing protein [Myxococcales bacterium]
MDRWVELQGPLTGASALNLPNQLDGLDLSTLNRLVLSFGQVHRIDTTGLVALVRLYSQCQARRVTLVFTDVAPSVHKHLAKLGLADLVGLDPRMARSNVTLECSIEMTLEELAAV